MSQGNNEQFLELYQKHRYEHQLKFYEDRRAEFDTANTEAVTLSIVLIFLAAIAGGVASAVETPWLKLMCLLVAAISPIISTAIAGYSVLYGFEQQAKLYHDTLGNLRKKHPPKFDAKHGLSDIALTQYVHDIENTFQMEQGQWGQLAGKLKPADER